MFLSDVDIKKAIKSGEIVISNFDESRLHPPIYDILLSTKFIFSYPYRATYLDPINKIFPKTHEIELAKGEFFVLHPGLSILGYSQDHFGSNKYMVEINGKSSLARIGLLVHNSASLINPGHFLNV